ncbi:hypothetical protein VI26_09620 [Chromobacterium sp. LK1]|nr:hypothetical protein VI26_09620 [Chromobacterium sp. LK1]
MLCPVVMFLQAQTSFGFDQNSLDLKASAFVDTIVPPPRAVNFAVKSMFDTPLLLESANNMLDILTAGLVSHKNRIGGFNYDNVLYSNQAH